MEGGERIIWVVLILFLNIIGAFIYLVYVHSSDYNFEKKKLIELKELTELKHGVLPPEEDKDDWLRFGFLELFIHKFSINRF